MNMGESTSRQRSSPRHHHRLSLVAASASARKAVPKLNSGAVAPRWRVSLISEWTMRKPKKRAKKGAKKGENKEFAGPRKRTSSTSPIPRALPMQVLAPVPSSTTNRTRRRSGSLWAFSARARRRFGSRRAGWRTSIFPTRSRRTGEKHALGGSKGVAGCRSRPGERHEGVPR